MTKRQLKIILELNNSSQVYYKAKDLAAVFHVSLRTIHQDLLEIQRELDLNLAELESVKSKGYRLIVHDNTNFQRYMNHLFHHFNMDYDLNEPLSRVHYILMRLLATRKKGIFHNILLNEMYISKSTLANDLKNAREILGRYNLKLNFDNQDGLRIEGSEINIRTMILKENIQLDSQSYNHNVKNIVEETLNKHKYYVSDTTFQYLIVYIDLALKRMMSKKYINNEIFEKEKLYEHSSEYRIASDIIKRLSKRCHIQIYQEEISYLTINLLSKKDCNTNSLIPEEVNKFIIDELAIIREEFSLDLTNNLDFRIALALHVTPLLQRLKYNIELKNNMAFTIKQNYPLAYDIATNIAKGIHDKYGYKVSDNEIAYMAIHINICIEKNQNSTDGKRILIICPNRKSETLLLRQQFYRRFSTQIKDLNIVSSYRALDLENENYDLIFTTENRDYNDEILAIKINYFLDENDYSKIELALEGIHDLSQLKQFFSSDLMYFGKAKNKNEIIQTLCSQAEKKHKIQGLYEQVIQREELGGTYYGEGVAIPHPLKMISNNTFISLAILKNEIKWNDDFFANIIMLVCIEKNNAKALQLWYMLSKILIRKDLMKKFLDASNAHEVFAILDQLNQLQ